MKELKTLYLFGNGFDIAHNINTPYSSFRKYLSDNQEAFLTQFEAMYHIQPLDTTEPWYSEAAQEKWEKSVLVDLWKYFEEKIGYPDVDGMHDMAESLVDSMPVEGIKDTLDVHWKEQYRFAESFQKYVMEWLETLNIANSSCKKKELLNNKTDMFINFNYTDTLERIYKIDNVLHIHGGLPSCSKIPPIMGHGNKYIIDLYRRKAKKAREEFIEWEESICNAIANYCTSLYKDTDRIISFNEDFFSSISDVERIVCLGISFGDVDVPYLNRIIEEIDCTTKWIAYYYTSEDLERLKNVFGILGISRKFEVYFLHSDKFWDTSI